MTKKFDALYESMASSIPSLVPFAISPRTGQGPHIDLEGPRIDYSVGPEHGYEKNKDRVRYYRDKSGIGKATNDYHPRNLKIRQYRDQLQRLPLVTLQNVSRVLGLNPEHGQECLLQNIVNLLGEDPSMWNIIENYLEKDDNVFRNYNPNWKGTE